MFFGKKDKKDKKVSASAPASPNPPSSSSAARGPPTIGGVPTSQPSTPAPVAKPKLLSSTVPKMVSSSVGTPSDPNLPPIPPEAELNEKYLALLQELGIGEDQKKAMLAFPSTRKWTLICQHKGKAAESTNNSPQHFVDLLNTDISSNNVRTLRVSLASAPMSWVSSFIELQGLNLVFKRLEEYQAKGGKSQDEADIIAEFVRCTRALMNARAGLDAVCNTQGAIETFVKSLDFVDEKLKIIIIEVLAALCLVRSDDHYIYHHLILSVVGPRMPSLVEFLKGSDDATKVASMTLLNALINGIPELAQRQAFRAEWKLADIIKEIRSSEVSDALDTQFDIFEEVEADDINPPIIYKDPTEALKNLNEYVRRSPITDDAISIFQYLATVPKDVLIWDIISIFVQKAAVVFNGDNDKLEFAKSVCSATISEIIGAAFESEEGEDKSPAEVIVSLKSKVQSLQDEIANLKNSASSAENLKKKLTSLTNELESLRQEKEAGEGAFQNEIATLRAELEESKSTGSRGVGEADSGLRAEIERLNAELAAAKAAPSAPAASNQEEELKRKLEELHHELQNSQSSSTEAQHKAAQAEAQLKEKVEELKAAYENAQAQSKLVDDLKSKLDTLQNELQVLQAKESGASSTAIEQELTNKIGSQNDEIAAKAVAISKLENELREALEKSKTLTSSLENSEKETQTLKSKVADLEKRVKEAEAKAAEAPAPVAAPAPSGEPSAELAEAKATIDKLNAEITQLKAQLSAAPKAVEGEAPASSAPAPPAPPPPPGGAPAPPAPPPPPGGAPAPPPPPPPPGGAPAPPGPPPPPGAPRPPGPPPPPGMKGKAPGAAPGRPPKREITPSTKMRGFNWVAVPAVKVANTFWDKADDEKFLSQLDTKEIESLFGIVEKAKEEGEEAAGKPGAKAKVQVVQLLDTKKSNNMSIMLTRFGKISHADVKKAIIDLDENVFTPENINALVNFVPTSEEIEILSSYEGDKSALGVPEKFSLEIMTIPRLEERLKAFGVKRTFENKVTTLKESLDVLSAAVAEAKNSKKFLGILELTLALGNYINGGTNRGKAYGFKLDSLHKLADVRTNTGTTLMNFLAELAETKYPEFSDLIDDFPHLGDACRESMQMLQGDLAKLKGDLNLVEREKNHDGHNLPGDKFKSVMGAFHEQATKQLAAAEEQFKKLEENYKTTCTFYCEDPKNDSQNFFDSLNRFVNNFDKAKKDNQRRKAAAEKAAKAAAAPKPTAKGAAAGGGEKGVLDNLIEGMKTGEAFAGGRGRGRGGPQLPPNPMAGPGGANVANEALAMFAKFKNRGAK